MPDWLRRSLNARAEQASRREMERFIAAAEQMTADEKGALLAIAGVLRLKLEKDGTVPRGLLLNDRGGNDESRGVAQFRINRLARQLVRDGRSGDAAGLWVWSYTVRARNLPALGPEATRLWRALAGGLAHIEAALAEGEENQGHPYQPAIRNACREMPEDFAPGNAGTA